MKEVDTKIKNPTLVEERRNQILDAALKLFKRKGFHAATMREISRETGMNVSSIYDYVGSKQGILTLMYKEMMTRSRKDLHEVMTKRIPMLSKGGSAALTEREIQLREFLRLHLSTAWARYSTEVLVLYRESFLLEKDVLKDVLAVESAYIRQVAEDMAQIIGLKKGERQQRLDVLANLLVYMSAFMPNRGWNLRKHDIQSVLDVVVDMFLKTLIPPKAMMADGKGSGKWSAHGRSTRAKRRC